MRPFQIMSPNLNMKIYSNNGKTPIKIILCEWCIVCSQERCLMHKKCSYFFENNQIITASCIMTLTPEITMNERFDMIGLSLYAQCLAFLGSSPLLRINKTSYMNCLLC